MTARIRIPDCEAAACPTCKASAGARCRDDDGRVVQPHPARERRWKYLQGRKQ